MGNVYTQPKSESSILFGRYTINESLESLLVNFYSDIPPGFGNITIDGSVIYPIPDGTIHRNKALNAVYIADTYNNKGHPVLGGNWTINGIGPRIFDSISAIPVDQLEIGEAVVVVGANTRLYIKSDNLSGITDVGLPKIGSIITSLIANNAIASSKLQNNSITTDKISTNEINGNVFVNRLLTVSQFANTVGNTNAYIAWNAAGVPTKVTSGFGSIFTKKYDSGYQIINEGDYLNLEHGFGTVPKIQTMIYRCVNAEFGYSDNDHVYAATCKYGDFAGGYMMKLFENNVQIHWSTRAPGALVCWNNGAYKYVTAANWEARLILYA